MKNWNADKIIGAGLIAVLLILALGIVPITIYTGNYPPTDLPMAIVTGLAGYMGRSLLEKQKKDGDENDSDKHRGEKI